MTSSNLQTWLNFCSLRRREINLLTDNRQKLLSAWNCYGYVTDSRQLLTFAPVSPSKHEKSTPTAAAEAAKPVSKAQGWAESEQWIKVTFWAQLDEGASSTTVSYKTLPCGASPRAEWAAWKGGISVPAQGSQLGSVRSLCTHTLRVLHKHHDISCALPSSSSTFRQDWNGGLSFPL